jgi:hypothetical protein
MDTTLDFIRQTALAEWLLTPTVLLAGLALLMLVFTGLPGRIVLEVESMAQMRRIRRR